MQANWRLLTSLGVAAQRIHYEFFGPATVLDTDAEPLPEPSSAVAQDDTAGESAQTPASSVVSFGSTGVTVPWDDACPSLLDLAEIGSASGRDRECQYV